MGIITKRLHWFPNYFVNEKQSENFSLEWKQYRQGTSKYNFTDVEKAYSYGNLPLQLLFVIMYSVVSIGCLGSLLIGSIYDIGCKIYRCHDENLRNELKFDRQLAPIYFYLLLEHLLILIFGIPLAVYYTIKCCK